MRQSLAIALALAAGAAVSGCASPIQSMMITEDTALVSVIGKNPDDQGKVIEASLQEAARLTESKGYRYFVIMEAADASKIVQRFEEPRTTPRDRVFATPIPFSGRLQTAPVYRDFFRFPRVNVTYIKPGLDITIRMYREGEVDPKSQGVWSTAEVLNPADVALPDEP